GKEATARGAVLAGRCQVTLGDDEGAEELFREALDVAGEITLPATVWQARAGLAGLAARRGMAEESADHVSAARALIDALARSIGDEDRDLRRRFEDGAARELDALAGRAPGGFRTPPRRSRSTARPARPAGRLRPTGDR